MNWGVLARIAFVAVIAYSAVTLRPLGSGPLLNVAFGVSIAGLIIFRHRENISRLLAGSEPRFESRKH